MKKIDCDSVKKLEGLAPGVSEVDRKHVCSLVLSGQVFQNFSGEERGHINERLIGYKGRIPSLSLFFQDVLFFAIAARRVKNLLDVQDKEIASNQQTFSTVQERMESIFDPQGNGDVPIQTSEDEERHVRVDEESQFNLSYRQIWLCALRTSSGRLGEGNRLAVLHERNDPQDQYQLALLASHLGFKSVRIEETIGHRPGDAPNLWYNFEDDRVPRLKRSGIPYTVTFIEDRKTLFIDQVHAAPEECGQLESAFVLQDIYLSFFGQLSHSELRNIQPSRTGHRRTSTSSHTGAMPHTACDPSNAGGTRTPSPAFFSQDKSNPTNTSSAGGSWMPRAQPSGTYTPMSVGSENPQPPSPVPSTTPMPMSDSTSHQAADSVGIREQLQELLDDLLSKQSQLDKNDWIIRQHQNVVNDLRNQEDSAGMQDVASQGRLEAINVDLNKLRQELESAKSDIHADSSRVKEQLHKFETLTQDETTREAQAIHGSAQHERTNREEFIKELQTRLLKLQIELGDLQIYMLRSSLGALTDDSTLVSNKVDTLINTMSALDSVLNSTNVGARQAGWTELQPLRDIGRSLGTLHNRLREQREESMKDIDKFRAQSDQDQICNRQKAWILRSTDLRKESHEFLAKVQTEVFSIEARIRIEYASAVSTQLNELATQLEAEQAQLEQLRSGQQNQETDLAGFVNLIKSELSFLTQNLSEYSQNAISQLFIQVNDGLNNAFDTAEDLQNIHRTNMEELETCRRHLHGPADLQKQFEISVNCERMKQDIEKRKSEQGKLGEIGNRTQDGIRDIHSAMAEALRQTADKLTLKAQKESQEAVNQGNIAEKSHNQTEAKHAAEIAQAAADKANQFAKLVLAVKHLVDGGHDQLREEITKNANVAEDASRQADVAAQSAKLWVGKDQILVKKAFHYSTTARQMYLSYKNKAGPSIDLTQDVTKHMMKFATKTREMARDIQYTNPTTETASSVEHEAFRTLTSLTADSVRIESTTTTTLLFELLNLIAVRSVKDMDGEEKQILRMNDLAQKAVQTGAEQEWEGHVSDAQKAMEVLSKFRETTDVAQTTAASQESAIRQHETDPSIYQESMQPISKIYELANACEEIQGRARSKLEEMKVGWWKELAAKEYNNAHDACCHAKTMLGKIPPGHNFTNKREEIVDAFQDADSYFRSIEQEWEKCKGPANEFQKIAMKFRVTDKARKAIDLADELLALIQNTGKENMQENNGEGNNGKAHSEDRIGVDAEKGHGNFNTTTDHTDSNAGEKTKKVTKKVPEGQTSETDQKRNNPRGAPFTPQKHRRIPADRRQEKKVLFIKIRNAEWENELHNISPGESFIKGQEICGRGDLYTYSPDSHRAGMKTAEGFAQCVAYGQRLFFLVEHECKENMPDLTSSIICQKAHEYYEIYGEQFPSGIQEDLPWDPKVGALGSDNQNRLNVKER